MSDLITDFKKRLKSESLYNYVARRIKHAVSWRIDLLKEFFRTPYLDFKIYRFLKSNHMGTSPISTLPPPPKNLDALDLNSANNHLANNQTSSIPEIVVSFTSYPARINQVHYTIYSIFKQTYKPNRVVLYLSAQEFSNKLDDLPQKLLAFCKHGLEIRFVDENYRSYKKIVYALKDFPESIWRLAINTTPSLLNSLASGSGTLYPPHCLHEDMLDSEKFLKLSPTADDIWIWAMAVLNNTKTRRIPYAHYKFTFSKISNQACGLCRINYGANVNNICLKNILEYFPKIKEKLLNELKQTNQG